MFRKACALAAEFTTPVVVSTRRLDGRVDCAIGAGVVLNPEGWILTAAHMLDTLLAQRRDEQEIARLEREPVGAAGGREAQEQTPALLERAALVRNCSYWYGIDEWSVESWHLLREGDIAVGRLAGFDGSQVASSPVFQLGEAIAPGASLCRLGFPFHSVGASFDEASGQFMLDPDALPIPRFPNEGMMTRLALGARVDSPPIQVKFVETSTPGLRGQSGGPIFDVDGHVWGIQVSTRHLPLGFDPELEAGGETVREHQFMNVGMGTASETVLAFLEHVGVAVETTGA